MKKVLFLLLAILSLGVLFACGKGVTNEGIVNKEYVKEALKHKETVSKPMKNDKIKGKLIRENGEYHLYKKGNELFLAHISGKMVEIKNLDFNDTDYEVSNLGNKEYLYIRDKKNNIDLIYSFLTGEKLLELKDQEVIDGNTVVYLKDFFYKSITVKVHHTDKVTKYYFENFRIVERPTQEIKKIDIDKAEESIKYYNDNGELHDIIKLPFLDYRAENVNAYELENKNLFIQTYREVELNNTEKGTDLTYDYYYERSGKIVRVRQRQYIYDYKKKELKQIHTDYTINMVIANTKDKVTNLKKYNNSVSNIASFQKINPKTKEREDKLSRATIDNFGNIKKYLNTEYELIYSSENVYYLNYFNSEGIRTVGKNSEFFEGANSRIYQVIANRYLALRSLARVNKSDRQDIIDLYDLAENKYIFKNYQVISYASEISLLLKSDKGEYYFFHNGSLKKVDGKLDFVSNIDYSKGSFIAYFKKDNIISVYNLFGDLVSKYDSTQTQDFDLKARNSKTIVNKNNTTTTYYFFEVTYKKLVDGTPTEVQEFFFFNRTISSLDAIF